MTASSEANPPSMIPMSQRMLTRASGGVGVLVFVGVIASQMQLDQHMMLAVGIICAVALAYIVIGIRGARGAPCDPMAVIWWSVGAACAAALLLVQG